MRVEKTVPVACETSGMAIGTAPHAMSVARLFGLDTGDWAMILCGLALSGLLFAVL